MIKRTLKTIACSALFAAFLISAANAIDSAPAFDDPVLQSRYENLTRQLRCLVCQNETIADSNASLAGDLRRELRGLIAAGKSDDEVLKFLTDRYGDFVLYRPPFVARTWILWATPVIALLGAIAIAAVVIRRRAALPIDAEGEAIDANDANAQAKGTEQA